MDITAIDPYYDVGTATMSTSSRTMTGQGGTQWLANVVPGDQVYGADGRMGGIVETVNSNTSITLVKNWRGANQSTGVYTIHRVSDSVRVERFSQRLLNLLLGGNLAAFGDLTLAANKGFHATGAGALATHDLTPAARAILALAGSAGAKVPVVTGAGAAALRDIVGTVSLSGGVTNGAILERGENANGIYTRYANGWQTCVSPELTLTHANASLVSNTWTFPASFLSNSDVAGGIGLPTAAANYTAVTLRDLGATVFNPQTSRASATVGVARIATATADAGAIVINCRAFAEGRWA